MVLALGTTKGVTVFTCIDLFCGLGGQSTGAVLAGHNVVWAANHNPSAVSYHFLNHPDTAHSCQDLSQADFSLVPQYDALLASPCCQGHSRARGKDRLYHDASRSTAWAVVTAVEFGSPDVLVVENVREFLSWICYPAWVYALNNLGYTLSPHFIDAADYGVPQNRERVFIIGTKSKNPLRLSMAKQEYIPASSVIDMNAGSWSSVNKPGRSPNTLEKIKQGRKDFGDNFLIAYYGNSKGGRSLDRPIGTITTRDRWAIIRGDKMRMLSVSECRDFMSFPDYTILPKKHSDAVHMLGNAVCPEAHRRLMQALARAV